MVVAPILLHLLGLLSYLDLVAGQGQCYFPGGALALGQYPCDAFAYTSFADTSFCCPEGWTCFSNSVCVVTYPGTASEGLPIGTSIRGTCTDPSWSNVTCGDFCLGEFSSKTLSLDSTYAKPLEDDPVGDDGGSLTACGDERWCCTPKIAQGTCNCDTKEGTFSLASGKAHTIVSVAGLSFTTTPSVSGSTPTASQTPSTASQTPSTAPQTLSTATALSSKDASSAALNSQSQTSSGQSSTTQPAATRTPSSAPQSLTHTIVFKACVGAGAGVFGFLLVLLGVWASYKWKQYRDQRGWTRGNLQRSTDLVTLGGPPSINEPVPPLPHPHHPYDTPPTSYVSSDNISMGGSGRGFTTFPDHDRDRVPPIPSPEHNFRGRSARSRAPSYATHPVLNGRQ